MAVVWLEKGVTGNERSVLKSEYDVGKVSKCTKLLQGQPFNPLYAFTLLLFFYVQSRFKEHILPSVFVALEFNQVIPQTASTHVPFCWYRYAIQVLSVIPPELSFGNAWLLTAKIKLSTHVKALFTEQANFTLFCEFRSAKNKVRALVINSPRNSGTI